MKNTYKTKAGSIMILSEDRMSTDFPWLNSFGMIMNDECSHIEFSIPIEIEREATFSEFRMLADKSNSIREATPANTMKVDDPSDVLISIDDRGRVLDILDQYTNFLLKNGYVDSDVFQERPTAIDQFMEGFMK